MKICFIYLFIFYIASICFSFHASSPNSYVFISFIIFFLRCTTTRFSCASHSICVLELLGNIAVFFFFIIIITSYLFYKQMHGRLFLGFLCSARFAPLYQAEVGQGIRGQCYGVFQVTENTVVYSRKTHARCYQPEEGLSEYLVQ